MKSWRVSNVIYFNWISTQRPLLVLWWPRQSTSIDQLHQLVIGRSQQPIKSADLTLKYTFIASRGLLAMITFFWPAGQSSPICKPSRMARGPHRCTICIFLLFFLGGFDHVIVELGDVTAFSTGMFCCFPSACGLGTFLARKIF